MANNDFSKLIGKVKSGSNEVFGAAKETAEDILRAAKYKSSEALNTADKKMKPAANNIESKNIKPNYDKIMAYLAMPESTANKLPTSTGEFSLRQWREVHNFFATNNIEANRLEPSILEYSEVQRNTIFETF